MRTLRLLALALLLVALPAAAATDCTFTTKGSTLRLNADCTTDATILIPDGVTLDGRGNMITAVDPPGDHFRGAVVANAGATAHVTRLAVTASGLANVCDGGADRLRGIMFEGAGGSITHCDVVGINQGASGCQEGNAIEIRNAPFDGSHPGTVAVEVAHNDLVDWQKTGLVANGDVNVYVHHNKIFASATQDNLAANSLQFGFGALGMATQNYIEGNQWKGTSNFAATAVLVYFGQAVNVSRNNIRGNSDIGIYAFGADGVYNNNKVFDEGPDHPNSGYDIGIGNWGSGTATNNKVRGFEVPYDPTDQGGTNKAIPGPMKF